MLSADYISVTFAKRYMQTHYGCVKNGNDDYNVRDILKENTKGSHKASVFSEQYTLVQPQT